MNRITVNPARGWADADLARGFEARRRDAACSALEAFVWSHATFGRLHPYADGNGRMARLLANLPVIAKGSLPILIPGERRLEYIESLASWQLASGPPAPGQPLDGNATTLSVFRDFCESCQKESDAILAEALAAQNGRRGARGEPWLKD